MSLRAKTEAAYLGVIAAAGGATIDALNKFRSQEGTQTKRKLPSVDAFCLGGPTHGTPRMGNYKYRTVITFRTAADPTEDVPDPAAAHAANVKAGMDALHQSDLAARLSAVTSFLAADGVVMDVTGFHCFGSIDLGEVAAKPEERTFVSAFAFEAIVCETDCT